MENNNLAAAVCRALSFIIQASGQKFSALLSEVMAALCRNFIAVHSSEYFIRPDGGGRDHQDEDVSLG
ncbi:hypothetical protein L7F22_038071 [Adiantum nelumboides]|nr:hypothetical protein [Adiantum nelumboides]